MSYGPNHQPPATCEICGVVLDVDGDDGMCSYTARQCSPASCDCGARRTTLCEPCATLEAGSSDE